MNLFVRSESVEWCSKIEKEREFFTTICAVGVVLKNYTFDDHSVLEFRPT